ncbi:hypothetical protein [Mannheimia haemolytica]|uniref:hypothetical protein n=1 Tax=Mannheimia haemolytica TaxID=75985 RepID=UPI001CF1B8A6|nr:hypothetical protein [Mannheimia haemolytica]MCB4226586.1 hypothetical protein [Mannheimia haemolytica]MDW0618286.1 hypothetical protein [Mannheimia haemolytica]MEE3731484.1 hypothetical protein [Mannheimia haemolytica]UQX70301.1 hypothetical protein M3705_02140 [Mannheimia haemolytica]
MKPLKPNFKTYPQMNRTFALNKIAVERCKQDFPDCYHFKKLMAEECTELADRLKMGLVLMAELKTTSTLTSDQNRHFKAFRNGAKYLIKQLEETALHVANVDKGEFEPTPYKPIKQAEGKQND